MSKAAKKASKILIVIFIIIGIILASLAYINKPKDKNDNAYKSINIEKGFVTADIADVLYKEGIISSKTSFKIISRIYRFDGKYQAGTYAFSPSMKPLKIAKSITEGKIDAKIFTIPEGFSILQMADRLDKNEIVSKSTFLSAVKSTKFDKKYSFLEKAQSGNNHLEGYLFPSTYHVGKKATADEIIESMLEQTSYIFNKKNEAKAKKLGYSMNDIIIIASLIEKEAGIDEDRAKVASVIYNRLKKNMSLQFCSTVLYAQGLEGQAHKEDLSIADTNIDSPYNTYKNKGLPPGPICSPGKKSIEAALNPENTEYLYFVLSSALDGSSKFSKDYSKFEKDSADYHKARDKQKGN